jgi:endonuclease G
MRNFETLLKQAVSRMESADGRLAEELRSLRAQPLGASKAGGASVLESMAPPATQAPPILPIELGLETIVLRVGRPVLAIVQGAARLEFSDAESEIWRSRLEAVRDNLQRAIRSVGRVELDGHPQFAWVGTAWVVAPDILLTNRHVAREFGRRSGQGFTFRSGFFGQPMRAAVDFLEEIEHTASFAVPVAEILHIEEDSGPDLALLRIEPSSGAVELPEPILLSESAPEEAQQIAVIGYPARDSRVPDQALMQSIFGDVYDKKRLAPGQIMRATSDVMLHDCSTLGGNSGSVVLDLATGQAVGLHFAGRFLEANFAVPASRVGDRVEAIVRQRHPSAHRPTSPANPLPPAEDDELFVETTVADYADRGGYDAGFLGTEVPLPRLVDETDVLTFPLDGVAQRELKYEHFSVVMSRKRRLCFLSAVNIDARQPHRMKRPGWRFDPRIPETQQIRKECYGEAPRFSRGHMTRREDPVWGEVATAGRGNADSMHVTNVVPQMQVFNAGIWLGLEDYALEHAREDDMRISVSTGPFLAADDPVRFGVQVPRAFWKVIAFIHDETGRLCATGYTMSQEAFLRDEEFVFGQHETAQVPIRAIEERAGITFGPLAAIDPLADVDEAVLAPLRDFSQIRFRSR